MLARAARTAPWVSYLGVLTLLVGLGLDAALHRLDPGLAAREDVFTLTNPGHALLLTGIALTVVGSVLFLVGRLAGARGWWKLAAAVPLAALLALSLAGLGVARWSASALAAGGHGHTHASTAPAGHGAAGEHGHAAVSVTADELLAASKLVSATRAGTARFADFAAAEAEGYRPAAPPRLPLVHYVNPAYLRDGRAVDPERPESLIYLTGRDGTRQLMGAMYLMPPGEPGPRLGGALTPWHSHDNLCSNGAGVVVALAPAGGGCPPGTTNPGRSGEMLHVWLVDNPNGVFDDRMALNALRALRQGTASRPVDTTVPSPSGRGSG